MTQGSLLGFWIVLYVDLGGGYMHMQHTQHTHTSMHTHMCTHVYMCVYICRTKGGENFRKTALFIYLFWSCRSSINTFYGSFLYFSYVFSRNTATPSEWAESMAIILPYSTILCLFFQIHIHWGFNPKVCIFKIMKYLKKWQKTNGWLLDLKW